MRLLWMYLFLTPLQYEGQLKKCDLWSKIDTTEGMTESQNHGIVEIGRDLQSSSDPTSLLKQGHLETVAQEIFVNK